MPEEAPTERRPSYDTDSDVERLVEEILHDDPLQIVSPQSIVETQRDDSNNSEEGGDEVDPFLLLLELGPEGFIADQIKAKANVFDLYDIFNVEVPRGAVSDPNFYWFDLGIALEQVYEQLLDDDSFLNDQGQDNVGYNSEGSEECDQTNSDDDSKSDEQLYVYLSQLKQMGPLDFADFHENQGTAAEAFMTSLGYPLSGAIKILDNHDQWGYVKRFLIKYVYQRPRLEHLTRFDHAVELIKAAKKIIIVTGAGISVSCGIPDFRSENGLYATIRQQYDLPEPECMFDIEYFRVDPSPFFMLAKELFPGQFQPSISHYFIKNLEEKRQLLRNYTQNIDTLEEVADIKNVVYCHGSFSTATCIECKVKFTCDQLKQFMAESPIPYCSSCGTGVVKPDIVFFGEPLPSEFDKCLEEDVNQADLLIVIGSSMKVQPVSMIPDFFNPSIPQILINRERLDHHFDIELIGDADIILREIALKLGTQVLGPHDLGSSKEEPTIEFVEPNLSLFSGCSLGSRPVIPDPSQDGSMMAQTLFESGQPQETQRLIQQMFPKLE